MRLERKQIHNCNPIEAMKASPKAAPKAKKKATPKAAPTKAMKAMKKATPQAAPTKPMKAMKHFRHLAPNTDPATWISILRAFETPTENKPQKKIKNVEPSSNSGNDIRTYANALGIIVDAEGQPQGWTDDNPIYYPFSTVTAPSGYHMVMMIKPAIKPGQQAKHLPKPFVVKGMGASHTIYDLKAEIHKHFSKSYNWGKQIGVHPRDLTLTFNSLALEDNCHLGGVAIRELAHWRRHWFGPLVVTLDWKAGLWNEKVEWKKPEWKVQKPNDKNDKKKDNKQDNEKDKEVEKEDDKKDKKAEKGEMDENGEEDEME